MLLIKTIQHSGHDYKKAVELRQKVLRTPLNLTFSEAELAAESNQIHVVAMKEDKVLGVLALLRLENGLIKMRQVAVNPEDAGNGIGKSMVIYAEELAKNEGFRLMVLNARQTAVGFYKRLNYNQVGEQFNEVGLPHFKMEKAI